MSSERSLQRGQMKYGTAAGYRSSLDRARPRPGADRGRTRGRNRTRAGAPIRAAEARRGALSHARAASQRQRPREHRLSEQRLSEQRLTEQRLTEQRLTDRDSDPALPPEQQDLPDRGRDDQAPRPPVAEPPVQLRDLTEVLAVEPDDERRDEKQRRDRRQPLHHLVLVVRDLTLQVVADAPERIAR